MTEQENNERISLCAFNMETEILKYSQEVISPEMTADELIRELRSWDTELFFYFDEEGVKPYLIMKYVEGQELPQLVGGYGIEYSKTFVYTIYKRVIEKDHMMKVFGTMEWRPEPIDPLKPCIQ